MGAEIVAILSVDGPPEIRGPAGGFGFIALLGFETRMREIAVE